MINEFIRAFALVFIAELGDKSQIIAMTFATQYKIKDVLLGVTIGVMFNHAIAILLGNFISLVIPTNYIHIIAGFLFIGFGLNSLNLEEEEEINDKKEFNPVTTVAIAFFIGELGDKTQLATMTIAAEAINPIVVFLGTTSAMVATSSLGIFIGSKVGKKIPEVSVKIVSSLVFLIFGVFRVLDTIDIGLINPIFIVITLLTLAIVELLLVKRLVESNYRPKKAASQNLYEKTKLLKRTLDSICLTEDKCGSCQGLECLLGYIRYILDHSRETNQYYESLHVDSQKLIRKNYDKKKVLQALLLILRDYNENQWIEDKEFVVNKIKSSLELMLFHNNIYGNNKLQYIKSIKKYDEKLADYIDRNI